MRASMRLPRDHARWPTTCRWVRAGAGPSRSRPALALIGSPLGRSAGGRRGSHARWAYPSNPRPTGAVRRAAGGRRGAGGTDRGGYPTGGCRRDRAATVAGGGGSIGRPAPGVKGTAKRADANPGSAHARGGPAGEPGDLRGGRTSPVLRRHRAPAAAGPPRANLRGRLCRHQPIPLAGTLRGMPRCVHYRSGWPGGRAAAGGDA